MVQLASLIACQAVSEFRVVAGAGLTPVELKEIVYQAVPYVGMAKVFDFLHAANDVLTEPAGLVGGDPCPPGGEELADLCSVVHDSTVGDRAAAREVPALPVRAGTPTGARTRVDWCS
jgi:hypothetical protein